MHINTEAEYCLFVAPHALGLEGKSSKLPAVSPQERESRPAFRLSRASSVPAARRLAAVTELASVQAAGLLWVLSTSRKHFPPPPKGSEGGGGKCI